MKLHRAKLKSSKMGHAMALLLPLIHEASQGKIEKQQNGSRHSSFAAFDS